MNLTTQPTNDPPMAAKHYCAGESRTRVGEGMCSLDRMLALTFGTRKGGSVCKGVPFWALALRSGGYEGQSGRWQWKGEGMFADVIPFLLLPQQAENFLVVWHAFRRRSRFTNDNTKDTNLLP